MTTNMSIERQLDEWLGSAPTEAADRVVAAVAVRISVQRQRPAWRFGWSLRQPRTLALVGSAAILVLLGAVVVGVFVTGTSPAPSPSPTAGAALDEQPLTAGSHWTDRFMVPFTYTVPDGWWVSYDLESVISLSHGGAVAAERIFVYHDAYPTGLDVDGCIQPPDWLLPHGPADLVHSLEGADPLTTIFEEDRVDKLPGWKTDLFVDSNWHAACGVDGIGAGTIETTAYPIMAIRNSIADPPVETLAAGSLASMRVLDAGYGQTLVILVRGDGAFRATAEQLIRSITFIDAPTRPMPTRLPDPTNPVLSAGVHRTGGFALPLTFTVPTGWVLESDQQTALVLARSDGAGNIEILFDVYPALNGCMSGEWDRPHAPRDLIDELERRSDLDTTTTATTVGGLDAWTVDVAHRASAGPPACPQNVTFIVHWSDGIPFGHGGIPDTFTALDDGRGNTLVLQVRDLGGDPAYRDEAAAIVNSFEFAP